MWFVSEGEGISEGLKQLKAPFDFRSIRIWIFFKGASWIGM